MNVRHHERVAGDQVARFDHNRILKTVAADVLAPLGLRQIGRSRSWIDDHGWWVIQASFDPSGFGRGTYLTVGTAFLWCAFPAIPFELDVRSAWETPMGRSPSQYIEAQRPDRWERDVRAFAQGAASHVASLRTRPNDVPDFLGRLLEAPDGFWNGFHVGVAAGLVGEPSRSRQALAGVAREAEAAPGIDWMQSVRRAALDLMDRIEDQPTFADTVASAVVGRRDQVGLEAIEQQVVKEQLAWRHLAS